MSIEVVIKNNVERRMGISDVARHRIISKQSEQADAAIMSNLSGAEHSRNPEHYRGLVVMGDTRAEVIFF